MYPSKDIDLKSCKLETEKGIDINDFKRVYKDISPKIEFVYALIDFYVLKGFYFSLKSKIYIWKVEIRFSFYNA
ncbi:hypothetical protein [Borrelia miyamotoi]|uniref:Uncharacterized protein n=1 Tax=Borrelia miyamotoi TaxID=47466 RepID=A0AAQ2X1F1_9SPIR|nr:hypothetical protein [Borrelia miyamotoi]WAZ85558.1 hypothetical protein O5400_02295 [Borrelia miyamotoi]WAZ91343.1 hypothetical protein O5398_02295 [Borrelia miyamotoi]WAZ92628.1 hypothetical protein O5402_02295 [Borrelia miyamotoi]WAZ93922.1 hypothetical protein O5399_02295 [Borrelia miyamotoi]WAZ95209.1 hypothetical protein O5397_02295 [Borrelia miyamotoi]